MKATAYAMVPDRRGVVFRRVTADSDREYRLSGAYPAKPRTNAMATSIVEDNER